ncbi:hypothetical protein JTB14_028018 [Gonioctena quinquepunctata]|nr:hypothetical protein JTB14_028018 [Gonioctena quinquepunctata]
MKDGTSKEIDCPEAIVFYNCNMGGVDLADQMITLYEHDRKSRKWWEKVFFRLLMTAVYNAHLTYTEYETLDDLDAQLDVNQRVFPDFHTNSYDNLVEPADSIIETNGLTETVDAPNIIPGTIEWIISSQRSI